MSASLEEGAEDEEKVGEENDAAATEGVGYDGGERGDDKGE